MGIFIIFAIGFLAIFAGLSVLFFVLSERLKKSLNDKMQRCKMVTTAQVVDIEVSRGMRDDDGFRSIYYRSVYQFYVNNIPIVVRPTVYTSKKGVLNQMVELRYDPNDPNIFYVPTDDSNNASKILKILGIAFAGGTVVAVIVCIIVFVSLGISIFYF